MADRYWVGGTANWDATAGSKWATTDGGAGGASVPTSADNVFFTAASGAVTVTITTSVNMLNLTCTGFTGTITGTSGALNVYGDFTLVAGMTWSHTGSVVTFAATSGARSITTAGQTLAGLRIGSSGSSTATWTLQDALTTSGNIVVDSGTFTTNNFSVTARLISSSNTNTRAINLGSSTVTFTSAGSITFTDPTNLTFNAGTSTINVSTATVSFEGGGQTFNNVSFTNAGAGTRAVSGSNTFNTFSVSGTTPTIRFTSGTTNTFTTFSVNGTVGVLKIIDSSSAGSRATLSKATGTVTSDYVSIKDSAATGGATWNATNATDAGNNTGWIINGVPTGGTTNNSGFFFMFV
jgi:hypothetical protein